MAKLIEDLAVLTDVSETLLTKLLDTAELCIAQAVHEARCGKQTSTTIDLSFGDLQIYIQDNTIRYKFVPSKELEKLVVSAVTTTESPIAHCVVKKLQEKIDKAYKEFLK